MKEKSIKGKEVNVDTEACSKCGGKCCKRHPGIYHPEDLAPSMEKSILTGLLKREISVDCWDQELEGQSGREFIRPSINYSESPVYKDFPEEDINRDLIVDYTWGGRCSLLTPTGCKLPPEKRPIQCRLVEPGSVTKCKNTSPSKQQLALAWSPFESIITESVDLAYKTREAAREKKGKARRTVLRAVVKKLK